MKRYKSPCAGPSASPNAGLNEQAQQGNPFWGPLVRPGLVVFGALAICCVSGCGSTLEVRSPAERITLETDDMLIRFVIFRANVL